MKKGFTLVELLGVMIVIMIVALISTPIILNVLKNAKREAFKSSVYGVIEAGELYYIEQLLDKSMSDDKKFVFPNVAELELKGTKPSAGNMIVYKDGSIEIVVHNDEWCAIKFKDETDIKIFDDIDECIAALNPSIYKESILKGADPELTDNMIAVNIGVDGTVKMANLNKEWYKYADKRWANAVIVENNDGIKVGDVIEEKNILAYFVWIPRYSYKLWYTTTEPATWFPVKDEPRDAISIVFEGSGVTSLGKEDDEMLTHPAFWWDKNNDGIREKSEEINGFWVGKFETGYQQNSDLSTIADDIGTWAIWTSKGAEQRTADTDGSKVIIKPNIPSWRNMKLIDVFKTVQSMASEGSRYGFDSTINDPHLIKNMEWGAIVYLSHSIYGKGSEVNMNTCSKYITGYGSSTTVADTICDTTENHWNGSVGVSASTTGNITGVYDMSGGAYDYVMGYLTTADKVGSSSGWSDTSSPTMESFITGENRRYLDSYSRELTIGYANSKLGDAIRELGPFNTSDMVSWWYRDQAFFATSNNPWFVRGANTTRGVNSGIFAFSGTLGGVSTLSSFRPVVLGR